MLTPDELAYARRRSLLELIPRDRILRKRGKGWLTNCMFHNDKNPSFSLIKFADGNWRFKCFGCGASGDPINYIERTAGMSFVDAVKYLAEAAAAAPTTEELMKAKLVKIYDYYDDKGVLLYQSLRYEPKAFKLRRPDVDSPGRWHWDMCGVPRVLYRLPSLLSRPSGSTCYYVEGEKDVETMEAQGLLATTHAGGALSYRSELLAPVRHLRIIVVPDNDDPGKQLMRRVFSDARANKQEVGFILLPDKYKDVSDYFADGGTREELEAMAK